MKSDGDYSIWIKLKGKNGITFFSSILFPLVTSLSRRKMIRCDHQNEYTFLIHSTVDFVCDKRKGLKLSQQNSIASAALRPLVIEVIVVIIVKRK
jgi:hypothetical protein